MRILGIDPGSRVTGFGVVQVLRNGRLHYVVSGCIRTGKGDLASRLKAVYDGVTEVVASYQPAILAIEKVFMARNADSALKLGQARGAALCAAVNHTLPVAEYTALQIKRTVVGKGSAEKRQVQHMVRALLELDAAPPDATYRLRRGAAGAEIGADHPCGRRTHGSVHPRNTGR